ncbi:MAG TPA: regulatory protein RecX [Sphingobacteriaceae bacterium]
MEDQRGRQLVLSKQQARQKIESYCAYQERSQQEVRNKLYEMGLRTADVEEVIAELIQTNFLNEERFALAYASGKFRLKQWGRKKIRQGLKVKGVPDKLISKALSSIEDSQYVRTLADILAKKSSQLTEKHPAKRKNKLVQYAISKGYETDLIFDTLKSSNLAKSGENF